LNLIEVILAQGSKLSDNGNRIFHRFGQTPMQADLPLR